jgi:hypothetical protein
MPNHIFYVYSTFFAEENELLFYYLKGYNWFALAGDGKFYYLHEK